VLLALSTGHKVGLVIAGGIFVLFALACAILIPRYRPDFPGRRGLTPFIVVTVFIFLGMLFAVETFGAEEEKPEEAEPAATAPGGGAPQPVKVTESEFKIQLPQQSLGPGAYEFDVQNTGQVGHDLVVKGPGGEDAKTPLIQPGKSAKLRVSLEAGQYELYCSVPGHKEAGMDLKLGVS
jgi:plastocyanin